MKNKMKKKWKNHFSFLLRQIRIGLKGWRSIGSSFEPRAVPDILWTILSTAFLDRAFSRKRFLDNSKFFGFGWAKSHQTRP